ncbi:MAG: PHP domain-containing protein [Eubacteriales bacterium]|nr:PHP domain-containing protein [Eubacteriales bacterium]
MTIANFFSSLWGRLGETDLASVLSSDCLERLAATKYRVCDLHIVELSPRSYQFEPDFELAAPLEARDLLALLYSIESMPYVSRFKPRFSLICDQFRLAEHAVALFDYLCYDLRRSGHGIWALALQDAQFKIVDERLQIFLGSEAYPLLDDEALVAVESHFSELLGSKLSIEVLLNADKPREDILDLWDNSGLEKIQELREVSAQAVDEISSNGETKPSTGLDFDAHPEQSKMYDHRRIQYQRVSEETGVIWGRMPQDEQLFDIENIDHTCGKVVIEGQVNNLETRLVSNGTRVSFRFSIYSEKGAIKAFIFLDIDKASSLLEKVHEKSYYRFFISPTQDQYSTELVAKVLGMKAATAPALREDLAAEKRVELHCHTQMSARDALSDIEQLIELAAHFGHDAIALTDHGVVQAFPKAAQVQRQLKSQGKEIKILYGMEGYLVEDGNACVYGPDLNEELGDRFVFLQLQTTGPDPEVDRILHIEAERYCRSDHAYRYDLVDCFSGYGNPGDLALSSLEDQNLSRQCQVAEPVHALVKRFRDYLGLDSLIALDALEALAFLRYEGMRVATKTAARDKFNPVTLDLSRLLSFVLDPTSEPAYLSQ